MDVELRRIGARHVGLQTTKGIAAADIERLGEGLVDMLKLDGIRQSKEAT